MYLLPQSFAVSVEHISTVYKQGFVSSDSKQMTVEL